MSQPVAVDKRVMVLGATSEAEAAVRELADLGYAIQWVPLDALSTAPPASAQVYAGHSLGSLTGQAGAFTAQLVGADKAIDVATSAVIVATGNQRRYPQERYGIALGDSVVTVSQLEQRVQATAQTGAPPYFNWRVFFLLDWEGETPRETAIELQHAAMLVRESWRAEVLVFYVDLKVDSPGLEHLTRAMREQGVVFCRYEQSDDGDGTSQIVSTDNGISIRYVEGVVTGDLLVLPEIVAPREDTAALAEALQVHVGTDGYLQDVNIRHYRPGLSNRRGVFFAGRCHADMDTASALDDVLLAVSNVDALLYGGTVAPEDVVAHVEAAKCIRCLTCLRSCPHAAVEIVEYEDESVLAARIMELACQGCGACVSNCPVRAIELLGQEMPAWMV